MRNEELRFGYWINRPLIGGGPFDAVMQGMLAEKNGFDSVWLGDHFMLWAGEFGETFTGLTAIGMKTNRVMLSPSVTDPLRRHPATLAQIIASVDALTKGRAGLGIGAGEALNLLPFGIRWEKPLTTLKEAVEVIKLLWESTSEKPANYSGKIFQVKNGYIKIKPVQKPHPPIYIGALRQKTRELVGEIADGYFPWINSPETYRVRLNEIERGAKKVGRSLDDIDRVAVLCLAISKDVNQARGAIQNYSSSALVLEKDVLEYHGYSIESSEKPSMQLSLFTPEDFKFIEEQSRLVPSEIVEKVSAFGTTQDCIDRIDEFIKSGANHIVVLDYSPDFKFSMRAFRDEIIPYFKQQC